MSRSTGGKPTAQTEDGGDRYLKLIKAFPLRPIRDESDLDEAIAIVDRLCDRDLSREEEDYLDVLSTLVEVYESKVDPEPVVAAADMLRHLIEAKGVAQREVAAGTGVNESTISEILAGKREISRRAMYAFADYFRVSPAVFL